MSTTKLRFIRDNGTRSVIGVSHQSTSPFCSAAEAVGLGALSTLRDRAQPHGPRSVLSSAVQRVFRRRPAYASTSANGGTDCRVAGSSFHRIMEGAPSPTTVARQQRVGRRRTIAARRIIGEVRLLRRPGVEHRLHDAPGVFHHVRAGEPCLRALAGAAAADVAATCDNPFRRFAAETEATGVCVQQRRGTMRCILAIAVVLFATTADARCIRWDKTCDRFACHYFCSLDDGAAH
jgi:hypothetical protein